MGHTIEEIMSTTMQKIRELADVNTIVGTPITTADGVTLIPVSKVSLGFVSGGSDLGKPVENPEKPAAAGKFAGGGGAGISITPVGFVSIIAGETRFISIGAPAATSVDRVIELVPEVMDKVTGFFRKDEE